LAGSFPRHAFMISSSKNIRVDNLYVDADLTDGTYTSSLFVDGLWTSFITNFTTNIPFTNSGSIGLYFKQGQSFGPNNDYGTYLVLVDNPTIIGGGGKYGIALEGNPNPASASFITAIHVNGGYIASQYNANIYVNRADYCTFEKIATDIVRTGSYAYFVTQSQNIEIEAGEYNPVAASGSFPSNYFLGTGPLPTNATGSSGNPTVYITSPDITLNGLDSASWAGSKRDALKISPINGSPYFYTQINSGFAGVFSVKGRVAYNGAPNNFWSQQERDIFKCTSYAGINGTNFTDTAFSSEPLIKYSGIGMELPWNSSERQRVYVSGALGVSNNFHVGVSSAGSAPEATTFSNIANGQITIAYPSSSGVNQYGGMLVFRQSYDSANLANLVNIGAIVGTKTSANGSFGGGLTFLYQPAVDAPMSASFGYNNSGRIGIGPIVLSSLTSRVQISGSSSETLLTVGSPSATSALVITGSGRVGIGTSTPSTTLNVNGTTTLQGGQTTIQGSGTTSATTALRVENSSSTARLTILDNGTTAFNTSQFYISSSGVSIFNSTTAPFATSSILDIANSNTASILSISNRTGRGVSGSAGELRFYRGLDYGGGNNELASPIANITAFDPTSGSSDVFKGRLLFGTQANTSVPILAMTIDENQNVGIGNTLPSFKLDVSGSGRFTGNLTITGSTISNGGFTGSLQGTASFATSASFAVSSSRAISSSFALSASFTTSASFAISSSRAISSSFTTSASFAISSSRAVTSSFALTASFVSNAFVQGGNSFGTIATVGTNDAQALQLETNGTSRVFVSSGGDVGIGTSSPNEKFVVSNGGADGFEWNPSSGRWYRYNRSTFAYGGIYSEASEFTWSPSGVEAMRISSTSNVGIGTNSPSAKLNVNGTTTLQGGQTTIQGSGTTSATTALRIQNSGATASLVVLDNGNIGLNNTSPDTLLTLDKAPGNTMVKLLNNTEPAFNFRIYNSGSSNFNNNVFVQSLNYNDDRNGYIGFTRGGDSISGFLTFGDYGGERVRFDYGGNVGIGTTSPTNKLDVSGSGRFIGNLTVTGSISSTGTVYSNADIEAKTNLRSMYQAGDEGGELFLNVPATNTNLLTGVTVDVYQDKFRIFESGGSNRGYYLEMTSGSAGVGTNLKPSGYTGTVTIVGNPPGSQNLNFTDGILISVT
jgi:hypothetical protein